MENAFRPNSQVDGSVPNLLLERRDPDARWRHRVALAGALLTEAMLVMLALTLPAGGSRYNSEGPRVTLNLRRATPLVAPKLDQFRLTQKEAQRTKPALEANIAALMPKSEVRPQPGPGKPTPPKPFQMPSDAGRQSKMIEAPKIEIAASPLPAGPAPIVPGDPAPDKLKNPFERVGGPQATQQAKLEAPKATVEEAGRSLARGGSRGIIVGDPGGSGGMVDPFKAQNPSQLRNGSTLELLSDPQGLDFRPYLIQVLAAVKRNWQAVIPESARFGRQGRVAIQFAIDRTGHVPKLVIAVPSGTDALDRAAVAGISASNPFPPLPSEFRGTDIRLQLVFSYNMPR